MLLEGLQLLTVGMVSVFTFLALLVATMKALELSVSRVSSKVNTGKAPVEIAIAVAALAHHRRALGDDPNG